MRNGDKNKPVFINDLYELEKDNFSDLEYWSWVIFYGDISKEKIVDVLTEKIVAEVDSGSHAKTVYRELLMLARKYKVIEQNEVVE